MPPEIMKALSELMRNPKTALFGNVLSRLQLVVDNSYEALAAVRSDGCLIYNPSHDWAQGLTNGKLKHVLLHEASHILLKHFHRISPEMAANPNQMKAFNIAADMALEHLLTSVSTDYIKAHHDGLEQFVPKNQWNRTMEQLMGMVNQNHPEFQNMPMDLNQLTAEGRKALKNAIDKSMGKAASQMNGAGAQAGKGNTHSALLSRVMAQYINIGDTVLRPLKKHFQVVFGEEGSKGVAGLLSQRKLLRREFMGMPMIGRNTGAKATVIANKEQWHNNVTLLIDVSGSVAMDSVQACLRFIQRLSAQHDVFPMRVLTFNSNLKQEFEVIDSTSIESVATAIKIGGGTNITRALVDAQSTSKLTLVFTDMEDRPVTKEDYNTGGKVIFVAYDYYRNDHFDQFTAGEWVDGNPMVELFK
jgi:predicted metal-dependent peptidase